MLRVGLTGGIGAGKSEVSRRLAARGAVLIDADALAREAVAPGSPGLAEVVAAFGPAVLGPDGGLDRARLGEVVFADSALLGKLNSIVHPRVEARMRELEAAVEPGSIVVHDVPLIAESGLARQFDVVVVVDTWPELQLSRLVGQRGMTREQVTARMAAQATREQRLAIADIVVDNSGTLAQLNSHVSELWAELQRLARTRSGRTP
jgi:dephospho-CoA kinase